MKCSAPRLCHCSWLSAGHAADASAQALPEGGVAFKAQQAKLLLGARTKPQDRPCRCLQGCTALHMAAHQGHVKAACWLVKPGAVDVDAVDNSGRTALHHAAALGHDGVVQALWARGCSVQAEDVHGWTGAAPT